MQWQAYAVPGPYELDEVQVQAYAVPGSPPHCVAQAYSVPQSPTMGPQGNNGVPQAFQAQGATFVQSVPLSPGQPQAYTVQAVPYNEAAAVAVQPGYDGQMMQPMQPMQPMMPEGVATAPAYAQVQYHAQPMAGTAPAAYPQQAQYVAHPGYAQQVPYPQQAQYPAPAVATYCQQAPYGQLSPYGQLGQAFVQEQWPGGVQVVAQVWQPDEMQASAMQPMMQSEGAPGHRDLGALHLSNLAPETTEADLNNLVAETIGAGTRTIWIVQEPQQYSSFAYVELTDGCAAGAAAPVLHGRSLHDRVISVQATSWPPTTPMGGQADMASMGHRPPPMMGHRGPMPGHPGSKGGGGQWYPGKGQDGSDYLGGPGFLRSRFDNGSYAKGGKGGGHMQWQDSSPGGSGQNGMYQQVGQDWGGGPMSLKGGKGKATGKSGGPGFNGAHEGPRCDLFVGRLADGATEANVRELFTSIGLQIRSLKVPSDVQDQPKGYAFVSLVDPTKTEYAIEQLNGRMVNGRPINVEPADPLSRPSTSAPKGWGDELQWMGGGWGSKGRPPPFGQGWDESLWESGGAFPSGNVNYGKGWGKGPGVGKGEFRKGGRGWDPRAVHPRGMEGASGSSWAQKGSAKGAPAPVNRVSNPLKLFVGNLTAEATGEDVFKALEGAGEIVGVRVLEGKFSGIAFVEFKEPAAVEKAVHSFQGVEICGRAARLERQGGGNELRLSPPLDSVIAEQEKPAPADKGAGPASETQEKPAPADKGAGPAAADIEVLVMKSDNHDFAAGESIAKIANRGSRPAAPLKTATVAPAADADAAGGGAAQLDTA